MNGLFATVEPGILPQFADDMSCAVPDSFIFGRSASLCDVASDMLKYSEKNYLTLNCDKTSLIRFSTTTDDDRSIYVRINGKSFGLTVDPYLKYKQHCVGIERKLCSAPYGVRVLRGCVNLRSLK